MKRWLAIAFAIALGFPLAACSDDRTPAERAADDAKDAQEQQKKREKKELKFLGIAMDKGGWNEAERTFTDDGKAFGIVSTGQVYCSPMFTLIPGTGETDREKEESAGFRLVAIVAGMDEHTAIPLSDLPGVFRDKAEGLKKKQFDKLVKQTRESSEAMSKICGNR